MDNNDIINQDSTILNLEKESNLNNDNDASCPICIDRKSDIKTNCNHNYCLKCIITLIKLKKKENTNVQQQQQQQEQPINCPICNANIEYISIFEPQFIKDYIFNIDTENNTRHDKYKKSIVEHLRNINDIVKFYIYTFGFLLSFLVVLVIIDGITIEYGFEMLIIIFNCIGFGLIFYLNMIVMMY